MRPLARPLARLGVCLSAGLALVLSSGAAAAPAPAWRAHPVAAAGTLTLPPTWANVTRSTAAVRRRIDAAASREPKSWLRTPRRSSGARRSLRLR
ncbi:MAG: hypothetical protein ICV64_08860 [Thermoleophilia bacterium]|nr:hypothetical protein [Thermoleophilia bacterium]